MPETPSVEWDANQKKFRCSLSGLLYSLQNRDCGHPQCCNVYAVGQARSNPGNLPLSMENHLKGHALTGRDCTDRLAIIIDSAERMRDNLVAWMARAERNPGPAPQVAVLLCAVLDQARY